MEERQWPRHWSKAIQPRDNNKCAMHLTKGTCRSGTRVQKHSESTGIHSKALQRTTTPRPPKPRSPLQAPITEWGDPPTKPQRAYHGTPTAWHGSRQHPGHHTGRQPCPDGKANGSEPGRQTKQQGNSKATRQWPAQQRCQSKMTQGKPHTDATPHGGSRATWQRHSGRERRRSTTAVGSHTKTGRQPSRGATSEADARRTHPRRTQHKCNHTACNKHSAAMPHIDNKRSRKYSNIYNPKVKVPSWACTPLHRSQYCNHQMPGYQQHNVQQTLYKHGNRRYDPLAVSSVRVKS